MMSWANLRNTLAAQLTNNVAWSTFAYPPAVPQPLSVVIEPADPYATGTNYNQNLSTMLRFNVRMYVQLMDNQAALEAIEDMAQQVRIRILDATQNCGDLSAPTVYTSETGDLLTAFFPVQLLAEWSQ